MNKVSPGHRTAEGEANCRFFSELAACMYRAAADSKALSVFLGSLFWLTAGKFDRHPPCPFIFMITRTRSGLLLAWSGHGRERECHGAERRN